MLNRWIARACIGLALLGCGLSASFAWAQTQTQQAVQSYVNITLPTIAKLRPLIDKPASERAGAFVAMGLKDSACDAPRLDAIGAREHLAEGAGHLCGALIAWMHDEDIFTCSRVKMSGIEFAKTDRADGEIVRRHKADDIVSTRLQLQAAAGCAGKTEAYWGVKTLQLYDQLAASVSKTGDLVAPSNGGAAPTAQAFKDTVFLCHLSSGLDDNTKSGVIDAANYGCYALNYVSTREPLEACRTLKKAIDKSTAVSSSDPLAGEAGRLVLKLTQEFGALDCRETTATAEVKDLTAASATQAAAAPSAPNAPTTPARSQIRIDVETAEQAAAVANGEYQENASLASGYEDRGDQESACLYYGKARAAAGRESAAYSRLYTQHANDLSATDITRLYEYRNGATERANKVYELAKPICDAVGKPIY